MARQYIVVAGILVLLLMTAASLVILQVQGKRDRLAARIMRITAPHRRRIDSAGPASGVAMAEASRGLGRVAAQLFGFDPAREDHYALRWWSALLLTLAVASTGAWLSLGLLGPLALLVLPVAWVLMSRRFFDWCVTRRRERLFVQFPDALAMIVRAVRVGIPVSDSIRAVAQEMPAPTGPEFARLADEISIGVPLDRALQSMSDRNALREYHFFATSLSLQNQTGGSLSETLDNLADVIRKRVAVRERGRALAAEAKTSAFVLGVLPPLAMGALWLMSPDYIMLLFTDPSGRMILGVSVGSLLCGVWTMRTMIRRSLS